MIEDDNIIKPLISGSLKNIIGSEELIVEEIQTVPVSDTEFNKTELRVIVPDPVNSKKASVKFTLNGADIQDKIIIDDVYFGPKPECNESNGNYICGDLIITKTSMDGDLYPYISDDILDPSGIIKIKDGNCKKNCEYKIISKSNAIDVNVNCP